MHIVRAQHAFDGTRFSPAVPWSSSRNPVAEALAAATSVAAGACGLGLETGRLAPGYAADLLVVDGDLARDPSLLGSPARVLVRGVQVDLT